MFNKYPTLGSGAQGERRARLRGAHAATRAGCEGQVARCHRAIQKRVPGGERRGSSNHTMEASALRQGEGPPVRIGMPRGAGQHQRSCEHATGNVC